MECNNSNVIIRHRLMDLLDNVSGKRVIYVCAPAGYGKSICIRQWLERGKIQHALISLDDYDNRLANFCKRFCEALLAIHPKSDNLREIVSHPAFESAPDEFTIQAIGALPAKKRVTLVIDDLQYITNERVQRLLYIFIRRLPIKCQIVLASRSALPVGLSDIWARDYMANITEEQLRFSKEEIALLYEKNGRYITNKQAERIHRITGGWAIAVNALLLSGNKMLDKNLFHLEDYIRAHVWERWDEETRDFMIKTVVLHELTPQLCDALTGRCDSEKRLKQLVRQNAFIMQVKKGVFQYHRLFHVFLMRMLDEKDKDYKNALLEAAGRWYLPQKDFYSAIDYFIECESIDGIAQCLGMLLTGGHGHFFIERVLPIVQIPIMRKVAESFPFIYSTMAWAAFNAGRADDMEMYLDLYYQKQSEIINLNPQFALFIVLARLIDFRITLTELLSAIMAMTENPSAQMMSLGDSLVTINQNMPLLHRGTRDFSECAVGDTEKNISGMVVVMGGLFGEQAETLAGNLNAGILYEQGRLDVALSHALNAYSKIEKHFSPEAKFCTLMALVQIQDALEETAQADYTLKEMEKIIEEDKAYYLNYNFEAFTARRKFAKGNVDAAREWLGEHTASVQNGLDFYRLYIHITTCRAFILNGNYPEAIVLLTKALNLAQTYRRPLDIIEARILLSIAHSKKKRGSQDEAISHLEHAVELAYQFGYTQMFINESAALADMLKCMQNRASQNAERTTPVSFIRMLYFDARARNTVTGGNTSQIATDYTDKQKEVMRLLCEGQSRQDIADNMGVKLSTVRSHIDLIYKKLDVSSAADAVIKIKEAGILSN